VVINHAKFHHWHDPIYESGSCERRFEPGEQSCAILPFQNCPYQHLVGVTFDLLGRGLQPYRRAVTGTIRCRESGYQVTGLGIDSISVNRSSVFRTMADVREAETNPAKFRA
jgi:hypothetical protein